MEKQKDLQPISLDYYKGIHRLGRITTAIMIVLLISVPFSIKYIYKIQLDFSKSIKAIIAVFGVYGIVSLVEFFSFTPLLGSGGVYLSFITGNITNMKLPAAISAMNIVGVEPGSEEGELVSVIAIAVSSLVTSALLMLGMFAFAKLEPVLNNPSLAPAFNNLMPALLGALAVPLIRDDLKNGVFPVAVMAILTLVFGYDAVTGKQLILLPTMLVLSVLWAYMLYKKDSKKTEENGEK